eukprot:361808-Chlamydomonas_euryale.AAC.13
MAKKCTAHAKHCGKHNICGFDCCRMLTFLVPAAFFFGAMVAKEVPDATTYVEERRAWNAKNTPQPK